MSAIATSNVKHVKGEVLGPEPTEGFQRGARPIRGFCNAPWTDDMMALYAEAEEEGDYYGGSYVVGVDCKIDITCSSCERLIYRKEYRVDNRGWTRGG